MWTGFQVWSRNWGAEGDLGTFDTLSEARDCAEAHLERYAGNEITPNKPVTITRVFRVRLFGWSVEATRHVMDVGPPE